MGDGKWGWDGVENGLGWPGDGPGLDWIAAWLVMESVHHPLGHLPDCGILPRSAGWKNTSLCLCLCLPRSLFSSSAGKIAYSKWQMSASNATGSALPQYRFQATAPSSSRDPCLHLLLHPRSQLHLHLQLWLPLAAPLDGA